MKAMGFLMLLTLPAAAPGQSAESRTEPPFRSAAGAFLGLSVPDVQASARWYSEKLGLRVVMEAPKRDGAAVAVLEGGRLIVELVQLDAAVPLRSAAPTAKGPEFVHGIFKAGLLVEDFDRTVAMLRARGAEIAYGPFPARGNQRANVVIRDNAGNLIQFFGPGPTPSPARRPSGGA